MAKVFCKKGFTLAELLIVIAIIGIMSSVVFAISYGNKQQSEVRAAADELAERINDLRQRALKGDAIKDSAPACGFGINVKNDGYETYYRMNSFLGSCDGLNMPLFTFNDSKIIITRVTFVEEYIFFIVPFADVWGGISDISVSSGAATVHVCISDSGVAKVKDSCL